jgi:hypothetical protein
MYLAKRGSVYWYRRGVPTAIRHIIGKGTHWFVTLGTRDHAEAKKLTAELNVIVEQTFTTAFKQLEKPKHIPTVVSTGQLLDPKTAAAMVDEAIQHQERRSFQAALSVAPQREGSVRRLARMRVALIKNRDFDDPFQPDQDLVRLKYDEMLKERGFEINDSPGYKFGLAKFRKAYEKALNNGVAWSEGNFDNTPDYVLNENERGLTISQCLKS